MNKKFINKLAKLEGFVDDLYRSSLSEHNEKLFPAEGSWFKIKELLRDLRKSK